MMKINLRFADLSPTGKILIALVFILLVFLAATALFYFRTQRFLETNRQIEHTHQVVEEIDGMMWALQDAETGMRGYVIPGEDDFLARYSAALNQIQPRFDKVRELTRDNPRQQERLKQLAPSIEEKVSFTKQVVEIRKNGDFVSAQNLVSGGKGESEMTIIRMMVDEMINEEKNLLRERNEELAARENNALFAACGLGAFILVSFFIGFFVIRRDMIQRQKVEKSRCQLLSVLESSEDFIGIADLDGKIIYLNQAGKNLVNINEEAVLNQTAIPDLYPSPTRRLIYHESIPTAIKTGFWLGETLFVSADGRRIPISLLFHAHKNANGKVEFLSTTARDITLQKQVENSLRESETRFKILTEKSLGLICTHDLDGVLLSVNSAGAESLEYEPAEMVGKSLKDFLSTEAKTRFKMYLEQIRQNDESSGVMHVLTKSGSERVWQYHNVLYREEKDEYVLGYALDISDLKRLEEELKVARDAALESARLKSEFLANMSHEIRTPMNGMMGMTELLLEIETDITKCHYLETIKTCSDTLLTLINDILDFSKIEAGKLRMENIDFNLRNTVENTVELFVKPASKKQIELITLIEPNVETSLRGDPARLRQVLTNLIGNAVKFTDRGEVIIQIEQESRDENTLTLRFKVTDTGIGISKENQKSLFQAFTQADGSITRRYGGTGLGLTISKQLIELMGGEIGVKSESGGGSTFWFTIRFEKQEDNKAHLDQPATGLITERKPVEKKLSSRDCVILLAEDNYVNQQIAEQQLKNLGYRVDVVLNGLEAVSAAGKHDYSLILMDCQMPEMDGYRAAAEIRRREEGNKKRVPIIAITANALEGEREKCLAAGMDDYLTKPFRKQQLSDIVEKWLKASLSSANCENNRQEFSGAKQDGNSEKDIEPIRRRLGVLQEEIGHEMIKTIIDIFLEDTSTNLKSLRALSKPFDFADLEMRAHSLKGSCSNLGAETMADLCAQLEEQAEMPNGSQISRLLDEIELAFDSLKIPLKNLRNEI